MVDENVSEEKAPPRKLGHYEVMEKIGQGGMAVVYKGVQPSLNRPVAIKVLPARLARTAELVERFDREASVVAQLNHPSIVQVIDRGQEGDLLFIVMEYVPSDSLDMLIRRHELTLEQTMNYAVQICDALEYAHGKGVIHRDLKPSNILIDKEGGRAKIGDFGIAGIDTSGTGLSTLTGNGTALGTVNYMSPEQRLDSHRVTHKTDIFSFGVLLYEMLTRKLPIGHFKLPSLINHSVPIGLDGIVKKCLEESPNDRYASAAEIKHDLERITTRHVTLRKAAVFTSRSVWHGKRRYVAAGVGAAALVLALVLALRGSGGEKADAPGPVEDGVVALNPAPPEVMPLEPPIRSRPKPEPVIQPPAPQPVRTPVPRPAPIPSPTPTQPQVRQPENTENAAVAARVQADFARAQAMIGARKRMDGITLLRQLVAAHGKSALAPEAQYAIARAYDDMKKYGEAKMAYDLLLNLYPTSSRAPRARVAMCRIEWRDLPLHGPANNQRDAESQKQLIGSLKEVAKQYPKSTAAADAYRLMAEIAGRPDLNDWRTAADALIWVYTLDRTAGANTLFDAAELYHKKVGDKKRAITAYQTFQMDFPNERRAKIVDARLKALDK